MEEGDFPDFLASRDLGDSDPFGQVFDRIKCLPATRRDSLEIPLSESFSLRTLRFESTDKCKTSEIFSMSYKEITNSTVVPFDGEKKLILQKILVINLCKTVIFLLRCVGC